MTDPPIDKKREQETSGREIARASFQRVLTPADVESGNLGNGVGGGCGAVEEARDWKGIEVD